MELLEEDQISKTIQANLGLGSFDGIDNGALDFEQLEEYINSGNLDFPDDTQAVQQGYLHGQSRPMEHAQHVGNSNTKVTPSTSHSHQQHQQQQQPQQQLPATSSCSSSMYPQNTPNLLNQQQKSQSLYPTQLPESPPDSGSEPYSPQERNRQTDQPSTYNVKSETMTTIPQPLYMGNHPHHHQSLHPSHHPHTSSVSPPHHQSPPIHVPNSSVAPSKTLYSGYPPTEPPKLTHPISATQGPLGQINTPILPPHMNSMNNLANHPNKKRKYESPNSTVNPVIMNGMPGMNGLIQNIKQEPAVYPDCSENDFDGSAYDLSSEAGNMFLDGTYQVIKWQAYQPSKWHTLLDSQCKELPAPSYRVDADKGFNFSIPDDAFVCQKKNHFQVTIHVGLAGDPRYIKSEEGMKKIDSYFIHFCGIKMESPSQSIKIEQSQSDRSKKPFHPVKMELKPDTVTKLTVGRLHYSETTSNNMRKKGKPNPDQRYFMLVVCLKAHSGDDSYILASHVSEKIIVRASNPGQFDSDVDVLWSKGQTQESVYHHGRVGVNTDRPDEALTVHGNLKLTGHVIQPSDRRVKHGIEEINPKEQLENVSKLKVYKYSYKDGFAEQAGLSEDELDDTGVIAQEVKEVLPDAVRETGDVVLSDGETIDNFLVVNKDRIYMENVGAVKELCKVTDTLENRIGELEKMNKKLSKVKRMDSLKSTGSMKSIGSCSTLSLPPYKPPSKGSKYSHSNHSSSQALRQPSHTTEEPGLCSNRFIQITVIILVLVMAFCLVSITTLYIFEIHGDKSDDASTGVPMSPGGSNSTNGTLDFNNTRPATPTAMGFVPPLIPPRCIRDPDTCHVQCCPSVTEYTKPPISSTTGPRQNDPDDPIVIKPIKPNGKNNAGNKSNGSVIYTVHSGGSRGRGEVEDQDYQVTADNISPEVESVVSDRILRDKRQLHSDKTPPEDPIELPPRTTIEIMQINHTIDSVYCTGMNEKCVNGTGFNYSYTIPIDKLFPKGFITIKFQLISPQAVMLCQESKSVIDACQPGDEEVPATPVGLHEWDLPVGFLHKSAFKFRVTQSSQTADICQSPDEDVGFTYTEYNLHFFRVCD